MLLVAPREIQRTFGGSAAAACIADGKGLGTAVAKLVLAQAFGVHAISSYRKCGFSVEGRAHEFSAPKDIPQGK